MRRLGGGSRGAVYTRSPQGSQGGRRLFTDDRSVLDRSRITGHLQWTCSPQETAGLSQHPGSAAAAHPVRGTPGAAVTARLPFAGYLPPVLKVTVANICHLVRLYRVGQKTKATDSWPLFCQILTDFHFFHSKIPWSICSKAVIKNPTTSCICCHHTL